MSVINTIVKEKKHVKRSDGYHPVSQWTSSDTVEMKNGKTLTNNIDTTLKVSGAFADAKAVGDAIANVAIETDTTLTVSGAAADAKAVGDKIAGISTPINSINVYYDPSTDMIYIKDAEGVWHDWASGGLKQMILYEYGKINELVFGTFDFRGTGVFNENDVTVTGSGSYNSWYEIGLNSTLMIDVTKYSKLNVEYKSTISTNASENRLFFGFSTVKAENDNLSNVSSFDASVSVKENTEGTVICDISDLNGVYYFKATDRFNTGGTSTITIKKIWLE